MADREVRSTIAPDPPATRERVGGSGIYPASGPLPEGPAELRGQSELAHPEERGVRGLLPAPSDPTAPLLLGRMLFGGFFLYNAINHFQNREMLAGYAKSKGVGAPEVAVIGSGAMLLAGSLSLLTGIRPKIGASLIAAFLLGVSVRMHAFWEEEDPQQRLTEMVNFTKNLGLVGGALFAAAQPEPWPISPGR